MLLTCLFFIFPVHWRSAFCNQQALHDLEQPVRQLLISSTNAAFTSVRYFMGGKYKAGLPCCTSALETLYAGVSYTGAAAEQLCCGVDTDATKLKCCVTNPYLYLYQVKFTDP